MIDRTETDWDSLFDSNTQIEREISDVTKQPPTLTTLKKPAVRTPARSPLPIPLEDITDICTQDLNYSSPDLSMTKDCSDAKIMSGTDSEEEREKVMEEYMDRVDEEEARLRFLQPWEEPRFPFMKQRPDSELSEQELGWISVVIGGMYDNLRLGHSHVKTLIAGRPLPSLGGVVPPWLVTQMAIKLEDNRQNGICPWSYHKLRFWAERAQVIAAGDVEEGKAAAVASIRAKVQKENIAKDSPITKPRVDFAKGRTITGLLKPHTSVVKAALKRKDVEESKSADEFDEFELSSQDLHELDI